MNTVPMRHLGLPFLALALLVWVLPACGQLPLSTVTVVLYDNQNPHAEVTVDTVLRAQRIDGATTPIDLFFACKTFHLPYYVPTGGLVKNPAQDRECNWALYPQTVRCYAYDTRNRVVKMSVNGSGTTNDFAYTYNDQDQVVAMTDNGHDYYTLTYTADGQLAALTKKNTRLEKKLLFIYQ